MENGKSFQNKIKKLTKKSSSSLPLKNPYSKEEKVMSLMLLITIGVGIFGVTGVILYYSNKKQ